MIIAIRPQPLGHLKLEPVNAEDRKIVRESNQYDGSCTAYLQDEDTIEDFLNTLTMHEQSALNCGYTIDVNIDSWYFRHMVGGQCD